MERLSDGLRIQVIKNILSREEKERISAQFKVDLKTVSSGFDGTNHLRGH